MIRPMFGCLLFAALTLGQTFEVKDRNGAPIVAISGVRMFRHSDELNQDIPDFQGMVKNVSGADLVLDGLNVTVHMKDGSKVEFSANICDVRWCDLPKNSTRAATLSFSQPWPYTPEEYSSVEFSFPKSWWQDRLAAEEEPRRRAAEAARRKKLAAEQKRKQAEAKAEEDAKTAEERRRIRVTCAAVYRNTVDKKVKDLTVGEEQQVRACQALGLYPPQ